VRRFLLLSAMLAVALVGGCDSGPSPVVVVETSMGNFKVELNQADAPITVKNFLQYVDDKAYDGTIFHRVIKGFVIQGGGYTEDGKHKQGRIPIKNEAYNGLSNKRGTIAMARTSDPNSATNEFYVNCGDNSRTLDRKSGSKGEEGYCVFGKVIEGMDVVDRINQVATDTGDWPEKPVLIKSIRRVEQK